MGYKIENITATIPCKGIQYCDLRPQVSADSVEEYREALAEMGCLANNPDFVERMTGETLTASNTQKIISNGVTLSFDPVAHTYSENGKPYLTGSTFASMFEEPFKADIIAPKVAEKKLTTIEKVLASWELKNQVSCDYGTAVHKSVELALKYGELPNNPHLAALAQDAMDYFSEEEGEDLAVEQFVCDPTHRLCGTVDLMVNKGKKHLILYDWKGLALDTLIPAPDGFTTMGEIKVGDKLYDGNGKVTTVEAKSEVHHKKCYKLTFASGDSVIADYDHQWEVLEPYGRAQTLTKRKVMTTEEIAKSSKPIRVPLHPGIQHKEVDLPVDPYVLGVWLGDGAASAGVITTSDPGIWDEILERGYKLGPVFHDKRGENCESRTVYGLVGQLKELGVWENKHIPATYLRASEEQRRDLLAGLLDTDGYYNPARREVTVDTTKDWWVDGLKELVGSLGGKTTVCDYITKGFGKKWAAKQIRILTRFNPFKVKDIDFELTRHAKTVREFNYVASCEEVPSVPTQCIKVTSPAHTYLFGRGFHTTHNTSDLDKKVTFTKQAKSLWPDLPSKLSSIYALQLSFYAYILEQQGYKVHGLHLMAETAGTWAKHTVPKLDIREALEAVWK